MKLYNILFSPTGGTKCAAEAITSNWKDVETIDLADKNFKGDITLEEDSLSLISMPSFGGLAPQLALDRLTKINASGSKCAIAAIYGNRAYDDTLLQMKDYAEEAGFQVIAAISAVAEHSIIRAYAAGRPDTNDLSQLCDFGNQILEKASKETESITVPGCKPYKKPGSAMVPKASSSCTACGLCAADCPAGAIDSANPRAADKAKCIGCMRCVSICPAKARSINPLMAKAAAMALKKACKEPKENELFI